MRTPLVPTSFTASTMLSTRFGSMNEAELTSFSRSAVSEGSTLISRAMAEISLSLSAIRRCRLTMLSGNWGRVSTSFTIVCVRVSSCSRCTSENGIVMLATVSPSSVSMLKHSSVRPIFFIISTRMTMPRPAPSELSSTVAKASSSEVKARERASRSKTRICSLRVISTLLRTVIVRALFRVWNTTFT